MLSAGPHKILRGYAHLCESAADVLHLLHLPLETEAAPPGVSAAAAASLLAVLELEGLVRPGAGGRFRLVRGRPPGHSA